MDRNGTEILRDGRGKIRWLMEGRTGDGGGRTNDAGATANKRREDGEGIRPTGRDRACVYTRQKKGRKGRDGQILMNTGGRAGG